MDTTTVLAIIMFAVVGILLTRSLMNFIAARKYGVYIKATMNLAEVRDFISNTKKPLIEVFEKKELNQVVILWKQQYSLKDYPSVEVYVDKSNVRPVRVIVRDENNNVIKNIDINN